jgi:hypothetical protein
MIKFENRLDSYAYRVGTSELDPSVTTIEDGVWVTYNAAGKLVVADGTAKKAWILMGSRKVGRDQVAGLPVKTVSFLHGAFFGLMTNQYDAAATYNTDITPLKLKTGGVVTPWVKGTDDASLIVAYAIGTPSTTGFLKICND